MRSFYTLLSVLFVLVFCACVDHDEEAVCTKVNDEWVCEGVSSPYSTNVTIDAQIVAGEQSIGAPLELIGYSYDALDNTKRQDLHCASVGVQTDQRLRCSLGQIADQQFVRFMVYKAESHISKVPVCAGTAIEECLADVAVQGDQLDPPTLRLVADETLEGGVAYSFIVHVP